MPGLAAHSQETGPDLSRSQGPSLPGHILPYRTEMFPRPGEAGHELFVAEYGSSDGLPLLLVHGTATPFHESQIAFINELPVRAIVFHQRGVGLSTPAGAIGENTTEDTVEDMEALRKHLNVASWHIYGWSFGSTLATLYAERYPEACRGNVLSGVFLGSEPEMESAVQIDFRRHRSRWEQLGRLTGVTATVQTVRQLAESVLSLICEGSEGVGEVAIGILFGRQPEPWERNSFMVDSHLKRNRYFLDAESLKEGIRTISHIPTAIVRGLRDVQVLPEAADTYASMHGDAHIYNVNDGHFFRSDAAQQVLASVFLHFMSRGGTF